VIGVLCDCSLIIDLLRQGLSVRFEARGISMRPAIGPGDVITIAPAGIGDVRPGDVVAYARAGRLFVHRLVASWACADGSNALLLRGDSAPEMDPVVHGPAVLGRVVAVAHAARRVPLVSGTGNWLRGVAHAARATAFAFAAASPSRRQG
jgi:hypothetical protein